MSKMFIILSEFRPKSVKGNLVPLYSKFEVRKMVPRNCVKTKFWTFVQKMDHIRYELWLKTSKVLFGTELNKF